MIGAKGNKSKRGTMNATGARGFGKNLPSPLEDTACPHCHKQLTSARGFDSTFGKMNNCKCQPHSKQSPSHTSHTDASQRDSPQTVNESDRQ